MRDEHLAALYRSGLSIPTTDLVTPLAPALVYMPGEKLQVGTRATLLNNLVQLVRLAGMLTFSGNDDVRLTTCWSLRPQTPPCAEQDEF